MGSIITRTLTKRQRRMKIQPNNEQDLKKVMKIMCSSLFFIPLFALGFMTTSSDLSVHHFSSNLVIGVISCLIMNASNPSLMLILGWLMVSIRSLFLSQVASFFYNISCYLVTFSIITKLYDYFIPFSPPLYSHIKYIFPSMLVFIVLMIIRTGYCCSQMIKIQKIQDNKQKIHGFGIRLILCIVGFMSILLTLIGHGYIRNKKFIQLNFLKQVQFILSIQWMTYLQIIVKVIIIKAVVSVQKFNWSCSLGGGFIMEFAISSVLLALLSQILTLRILNRGSNVGTQRLSMIFLLILWILFLLGIFTEYSPYITDHISILLCYILMVQSSNLFINETRINYLIGIFLVVILGQFQQKIQDQFKYYCYLGIICGLVPISLILQFILINKHHNNQNNYQSIGNNQKENKEIREVTH